MLFRSEIKSHTYKYTLHVLLLLTAQAGLVLMSNNELLLVLIAKLYYFMNISELVLVQASSICIQAVQLQTYFV